MNRMLDEKLTWCPDNGEVYDEDIYENGVCVEICEEDE